MKETVKPEAIKSIKGFKASSDIENFYRFIYENGLRAEAKMAVEYVAQKMAPLKKKKGKGRGRKAKKLQ